MTNGTEHRSSDRVHVRLPHLPALDGLRAVAVIAVLLYHANLAWISGGFLGVEMFFVISGYLITSLLLAEWSEQGCIDFKAFWLRRARRLLPALFALLVAVAGYAVLFLPAEVASLRGDVLSTAGYINNWYQILGHKSYFESVGRPSLLRHMWSLAVEEQFYLLWPLLFALLLRRLRPRLALLLVLAGAVASCLAMALMFQPNADPSRVYYGTDTRAAGLLLGVALAFVWRPGQVVFESGAWVPDAIGLAGLGTLFACFVLLNEFQPFLYRGGFALVDIATVELLAVAVHPGARLLPRLLTWQPLRWVGLRSYGIYLWHFPVFMLTRPQLDVTLDGPLLLAARLGLTVLIAALSYRFLETPIRNGALGRAWQAWRRAAGREKNWLGWRWAAASLALLVTVSVLGLSLLTAQPPPPPAYLVKRVTAKSPATNMAALASAARGANPMPALPRAVGAPTQVLAQVTLLPALTVSNSPPSAPVLPNLSSNVLCAAHAFTAIGDSVMEGVADDLRQNLGTNAIVDADQGRLPWNTPAIVRNLRAAGKLGPVIILQIGNNGYLSPEVFAQIMIEFKDARRVVVLNVKVPRHWESPNNTMLAAAVKNYPNAVLVDWHSASAAHPRIFWKDGIHVRPDGAKLYAALVTQAVRAP